MRKLATAGAVALTIASAWALYSESNATRRLEAQVQADERRRDRLDDEIAVLKAEHAWLARPQRIEPAARALGMRPPVERQYVRIEDITSTGARAELSPTALPSPSVPRRP